MKLRLHVFTIANDQLGDQNPLRNKVQQLNSQNTSNTNPYVVNTTAKTAKTQVTLKQ